MGSFVVAGSRSWGERLVLIRGGDRPISDAPNVRFRF